MAMMFWVLALLPVMLYMLGEPLYRKLWPLPGRLQSIIVPQIFGLFLAPAIFTIAYILAGWDVAIYTPPIVAILVFLLGRRFPSAPQRGPLSRYELLTLFIVTSVSAIGMLPQSGIMMSSDTAFYITATRDMLQSHHLPPGSMCLPGEPYKYSWFWNLLTAMSSVYSRMDPLTVMMVLVPYFAFLFAGAALMAGKSWFDDRKASIAISAVLIAYFFGFYNYATTPGYALPVLTLFIAAIMTLIRRPEFRCALTAGLLAAMLVYMHGLSFAYAAVLLLTQALWFALRGPRGLVLPMMLPLALVIPYLLTISGSVGQALLFLPFANIMYKYVSVFGLLIPLAAFSLWLAIREKDEKNLQLTLLTIIPLLIANIFIMPYGVNILRLIHYTIFPIAFLGLQPIVSRQKLLLMVVLLVIVIPQVYAGLSELVGQHQHPAWYDTTEGKVSLWLRENADENSAIVAAPIPIYSGISGRSSVVCEPDFLISWFYDKRAIRTGFEDLLLLYRSPSRDIVSSRNATYFLVGDNERAFLMEYDTVPYDFSNSEAFQAVFKVDNTTVYRLVRPERLPSNSLPRESLNFTSYSRWWEI